jgi:tetratricopeptide (TPR) repeat protein
MEYLVPILIGFSILVIITRPFTVLFHELGHAIPLMLLTGEGATIYIGSHGNQKHSFKLTVGKLKIWFRYNPIKWCGGLCIAEAKGISLTKRFIYILGGPVISLVIAATCFYLTLVFDLHGSLKLICLFAFCSTIYDLFVNLIPREVRYRDGKMHYSDGYYLFNILTWRSFLKKYNTASELFNNKKYKEAGELFEVLTGRYFFNEDVYRLAYFSFIQVKMFEKAYVLLGNLSRRYELDSDDYYNYGYVCSCLNFKNERNVYMRKSLELKPDNPYALNAVGYELNMSQQYQEAIPYFDRAIAVDKDFAYAYNNRGHAKMETGQLEEGLMDIEFSLQLNNENSYAHRNLGIYHLKRSQLSEAHQLFLKAKEMDSETDLIDELIAQTTYNK